MRRDTFFRLSSRSTREQYLYVVQCCILVHSTDKPHAHLLDTEYVDDQMKTQDSEARGQRPSMADEARQWLRSPRMASECVNMHCSCP